MITDDMLTLERPYDLGGVQRIYTLPNGYQLSAINSLALHYYPFAWEIAVREPNDGEIAYNTPLTGDVEVFSTDEEANEFIAKSKAWAEENER